MSFYKELPKNLFEIQIASAFHYWKYDELRLLIDEFAEQLSTFVFQDDRFRSYNYHMQFHPHDVKMVFRRILVFGECKIEFKQFGKSLNISFKNKGNLISFVGMFLYQLTKIDFDGTWTKYKGEVLGRMKKVFYKKMETKYQTVFLDSIERLRSTIHS